MPSKVDLVGIRGDGFERVIPLYTGTPKRALTAEEIAQFSSVYPDIRMQVRKLLGAPNVLIDLSSSNGELEFTEDSGLRIKFAAAKASPAVANGVYDIQFSGPNREPYTLVGGSFTLIQDVTDAAPSE